MRNARRKSFVPWDEAEMTAHHVTGRNGSLHGFHPQGELASRHLHPVVTPAKLWSGRCDQAITSHEGSLAARGTRSMSLLDFGPGRRLGWIGNLD